MDPELVKEMVKRGLLPPEEAAKYLQETPQQPAAEAPPSLKGSIDAIGTGLAKGAIAGTAGLPGDMEKLAQWGYQQATGNEPWKAKVPFSSEDVYKSLEGVLHKPQNAQERYLEAGGEGATALLNPLGFIGKGKIIAKAPAAMGALMGLGSEAGREALSENPVVGGVAGASAPAAAKLLLSSPSIAMKLASMLPGLPEPIQRLLNRPVWTKSILNIAKALLDPRPAAQFVRRQSAIQQSAPELPPE